MKISPLSDKDILKIERSSLVDFIIDGMKDLEQKLSENKLNTTKDRLLFIIDEKVKINNLLKLLQILVVEAPHDPLTGKLLFEIENMMQLLQEIQHNKIDLSFLEKEKELKMINPRLDLIIKHIENWRTELLHKIILPPGNTHTSFCYHPEFHETYKYRPSYLPPDYHSNFFCEIMLKELCPFTTLISFHPYSDFQSMFQEKRSMEELTRINIDVEIRDNIAIEEADNIRVFRVHGPGENKRYPGSYIMIKGGHHRLRALFIKYLKGEVSGDMKILAQLSSPDHFPISKTEIIAYIELEIKKRHAIRQKHYI